MDRRTLFKTTLAALAALGTGTHRKLLAKPPPPRNGIKMVIFGVDALRHDSALQLRGEGSPALAALNAPVRLLSGGGYSVTQPGWASIWSGLCSVHNNTYQNDVYQAMPVDTHIMGRLIKMHGASEFFPVWITGKGENIKGYAANTPHYQVFKPIVLEGKPGIYKGDRERSNQMVYLAAYQALSQALKYTNFCCFIHFRDPDHEGHEFMKYDRYLDAAREVDQYVFQLMQLLPPDVDIVYCSDHGFNFTELGEVEDAHQYAPRGMLATNFSLFEAPNATRESVGRLIYRRAGGDPDLCQTPYGNYAMYGVDLL
jgi:hypothetical protein